MALYNYDRHKVVTTTNWMLKELPEVINEGERGDYRTINPHAYADENGQVIISSRTNEISPTQYGKHYFNASGRTARVRYYRTDRSYFDRNVWSEKTEAQAKGEFIDTVVAEEGTLPNDGVYLYEGKYYWFVKRGLADTNKRPKLTLTTLDNQTYYEGNNVAVSGSCQDEDKGDVVIVKMKLADSDVINLDTRVSDGSKFDFSKTYTFKQGRFYTGNTPITGTLSAGVPYNLEVWAEDSKGAKSDVEKRIFNVVLNRPPVIMVTKTPSFTNASRTQIMSIEGTTTDPDGDKVTVTIKHDNKPVVTLPLTNNKWSHTFLPSDLNVGANAFIITATDDRGLSHTKTVRISSKKYVSDMTHVPLVSLLDVDLEGVESDGGLLWIRRASDKTEYSVRIATADKKDGSFVSTNKSSHIVNGMPRDQFTGETGAKSNRVTFEVTAKGAGSVTMIQGVVK